MAREPDKAKPSAAASVVVEPKRIKLPLVMNSELTMIM
jgi:hypothetical protein